jgi:hypothetical protein
MAACFLAAAAVLARIEAGPVAPHAFVLETREGKALVGPLEAVTPGGSVRLAASKASLKVTDWLTLRRDQTPLQAHPRGRQIVLANGDRVPLADKATVKIAASRLVFDPAPPLRPKGGKLEPPLASVAVIWLGGPDHTEDPGYFLRRLLTEPRKKDVVLLRDGDCVEGRIVALDSTGCCRVDLGKRLVELPWANLGAVAFSTDLLTMPEPKGPFFHLVLAGGCRLGVESLHLEKGAAALTCKTLAGDAIALGSESLVAVDVRGGAATYLSDLKPLKYEQTPFVGGPWPLVKDGSVTNHELRLSGSTFDKGLGMHGECRVTYELAGKYRRFEAKVGLDPEHGKRGRVKIRVLVDGKECDLNWKKELTARDDPLSLRVDIRAARELTLVVALAGFGDVQAHVNWADARLVE